MARRGQPARGVLQRAGTDRARSAAREFPGRCADSSGLLDRRNRTDPALTPEGREQNHRDPVPNHKGQDLPNHTVPVLNRRVPAPALNHKGLGRSSAGLGPNHRDLALPNRQDRRRTLRVRMAEKQVLHRSQVLIRMPALGRTVVGCSARGSARADHATAVVLIRWGAAANSSIAPVARGDRVVKLHVSV